MQFRLTIFVLAVTMIASACGGSAGSQTAGLPADVGNAGGDTQVQAASPPPSADAVADLLASAGFNGVAAIAQRDEIAIVPRGSVDPTSNAPVGEGSVFDIGSITKQFTGAAIVALHMDGVLAVDDRVGDYMPTIGADKADITLHQLLTHTAGLPAGLGYDYDVITRDDYIALVADTPLTAAPGERYAYSNVGYSLLAAVIEVATGDSYETYLRNRLFEPAGLIDTGYLQADWSDNEIAVGYLGDEVFGRPTEQVWSTDGPYWHLRGNGGLLSTASDMLQWVQALAGNEVLNDDAKQLLFGEHVSEGGDSSYGYGWSITDLDGHPLITHNGGNGVFFADLLHFPDDELTVFVATNSADTVAEDIAWILAAEILGAEGPTLRPAECPVIGPDEVVAMDAIDEAPATAPGRAFAELVAVMTGAPGSLDDQELAAVADRFFRPHVAPGATDETIRAELEAFQNEFEGYDTARLVAHEDERTFAVWLLGGGEPLVFSATLSETDPAYPRCINVSA